LHCQTHICSLRLFTYYCDSNSIAMLHAAKTNIIAFPIGSATEFPAKYEERET
jgi:hypothetical protein